MGFLDRALFRAPPNGLAECHAPRGHATILTIDSVDRTDAPGGAAGGLPGRPGSHYISATPQSELQFAELFAIGSPFVLYSIEHPESSCPFVVFLALSVDERRALWLDEAFIDRGIRKLVAVGAQAAVASLETAIEFVEATALDEFATGRWRLSFLWNTGRCGSTLMHKVVSAMGVASFSEPQWLDQLLFAPPPEPGMTERALRTCVALEALIARLQTAIPDWSESTNFIFNPKAGMRVAEAAALVSITVDVDLSLVKKHGALNWHVKGLPSRQSRLHVSRVSQGCC